VAVGAVVVVVVVAGGAVVVVAGTAVVVVVAGGAVVVVLPDGPQPPAEHASQQLGTLPTHAVPPGGGLHASALRLMLHRVPPSAAVRQHVTKPGFPQVDWAAQLVTAPAHGGRRAPFWTAAAATSSTQFT